MSKWKILHDSVVGELHKELGLPCQDSHRVLELTTASESMLVAVCADGAGSATYAEEGADLCCNSLVELVAAHEFKIGDLAEVTRDTVVGWLRVVRERILHAAELKGVGCREFACTALLSVVSQNNAVFAQIGDGAIVAYSEGVCGVVFWPQSGEYVNQTHFITDDDFEERIDFVTSQSRLNRVALLTDGLERLFLDFASQAPHRPFFDQVFDQLESAENYEDLFDPMRIYLESVAINERTTDDKTLILASQKYVMPDEPFIP
ncbi:PP2C family serine/threonine-protein phosphatase [Aeoliella sp. SH292]|uniref:PP2C family serine/threonine-protein phosphatase n=1 Tax=Aeoliella sp. SH292 TaxID=3454464 RepID=UPI003F9CE25C